MIPDGSDIIRHYFPELSPMQYEQLELLGRELSGWNQKINLVSRKDIEHIFERHILHSLALVKVCRFSRNTRILDIGTGGGFPGLPLAICFPACHFLLVDSIGKKTQAVYEMARELGLSNVKTLHERAEKLKTQADFILGRAVTAFPDFVKSYSRLIRAGTTGGWTHGIFYYAGGEMEDRVIKQHPGIQFFPLHNYFNEAFFNTKKIIYMPVTGTPGNKSS